MGAEISTIPTEREAEKFEVVRFELLERETELELPKEQLLKNNGLKKSKSMSSFFKSGWKKTERAVSSFGETLKAMCDVNPLRNPSSNFYY